MSERRENLEPIDVEVQQAYRALPDEEVPAELDAHVMQAARDALNVRGRPAWVRWSGPIAAAASLLVVVAIVLDPGARKGVREMRMRESAPSIVTVEVPPRGAELPAVHLDSAPQAFAPDEATQSPAVAAAKPEPAPAKQEPRVSVPRPSEPEYDVPVAGAALPQQVAPTMAATAEAKARADAAAAQQRERRAVGELARVEHMRSPAAPPPPAAAAPKVADTQTRAEEVEATAMSRHPALEAWLEKILNLQRHGHDRQAAREIAKLRKAYPDIDVQTELRRLREAESSEP